MLCHQQEKGINQMLKFAITTISIVNVVTIHRINTKYLCIEPLSGHKALLILHLLRSSLQMCNQDENFCCSIQFPFFQQRMLSLFSISF